MTASPVGRRIVFQGLGALGVAAALAGCGGGGGEGGAGAATPASGAALATTSEVPVGGGIIVDAVVITQPTQGVFEAFTATCTHQGSALDQVGDDGIQCPLHGSRFSIEDGSPTVGPATEPLARVEITLDGDQIVAV